MQGKRKKVERKARAFRIIRSCLAYISVTAVFREGAKAVVAGICVFLAAAGLASGLLWLLERD
jgi:hypothetical protein